jgi:sulfatase maturation enzyme AslB (radical SAM superfamily)
MRIRLVGGEPLWEKNSLLFLQKCSDLANKKDLSHLSFDILTNGILIMKTFEILRNIRNVNFSISIDSTRKEVYEYIRRGAKWESARDNILFVRSKENELNWSLYVTFVVMKSNLTSLSESIQWSYDNGVRGLTFVPIYGMAHKTENIFVYNYLLGEVPSWEKYFDETIKLAEELGYTGVQNQLIYLKSFLLVEPIITKKRAEIIRTSKEFDENSFDLVYLDKMRILNGHEPICRVTRWLLENT